MLGKTPVLGVDVGEHSVKYVLLSDSGGELTVEHFGVVDLKGKGEILKDLFGKIRAGLAAKGIAKFRTVAGISGQSVFLRFVRLPPVPKRQMDQIVGYEAQQQVPFPIEDVRWDYQVLSAANEEERDVVLVAVKNEIAQQTTQSFTDAGLKPLLLDASVLAIYNCLARSQVIHPGTSSMILDIGAKTTHMMVADRGGLWVRSIPIAGNHLTQAVAEALGVEFDEAQRIKVGLAMGQNEFGTGNPMKEQVLSAVDKALARLFGEISRSLGFYRSQYPGTMINDIYLCGGGALLRGLDQAAKDRFNLPVKRLDSLAGFKVAPGINSGDLNRNRVFLAGAIGLALRLLVPCRLQIDLVPHDVRKQRVVMRRLAYVSATYLVLLFMGIGYWLTISRLTQIQQLRTHVLEGTLRDMEVISRGVYRERDQVEVLRSKFQRVEQSLLDAGMWQKILSAIAGVLPSNFWLVRIAGERMVATQAPAGPQAKAAVTAVASAGAPAAWGSLLLEGKTSGNIDRDVPLFRESLLRTGAFDDVEIASAQVEKGIVEFSLKVKVKRPS